MIRKTFVRAMSGSILLALLGVKPWRLDVEEQEARPMVGSHATRPWNEANKQLRSQRFVETFPTVDAELLPDDGNHWTEVRGLVMVW